MTRPNSPAMEAALAMVTDLGKAQAAARRAAEHIPFGYEQALVRAKHMLAWAERRQTEAQRALYAGCLRDLERLRELVERECGAGRMAA